MDNNSNNNNNDLFDMYNSGGTRNEDNKQEANNLPVEEPLVDVDNNKSVADNLPVEEPLINTDNNESEKAVISESVTQEVPLPVEEPVIETKAIPDSVMQSINNDNEKLSEDDLLKLYVGNNYEAIAKGGFSFLTFFLGAWYLFYRKQYKYALPWIGLEFIGAIVSKLVPIIYVFTLLISFGIGIYFAIIFKKNYMNEARKKVSEIANMDIDNAEKKKLAMSNGGVDNKVFIILAVYMMLSYFFTASSIKNNKVTVKDEVEFKVPDWAKSKIQDESKDTTVKDKYQYVDKLFTYRDSKNECIVRLSSNDEYVTVDGDVKAREYMNEVLNKEFAFTNQKFNKVNLLYYYDNEKDNYYYIYTSDNIMQLLKVTIKRDDSLKCTKLKDDMVKSVKYLKKN